MSIGLIGTKIGMTREFMESGQSVPVTVIKVEKGRVLDVISEDKRGYSAVKLGFSLSEIKNNYWSTQSMVFGYNCIECNQLPCVCECHVYVMKLGSDA